MMWILTRWHESRHWGVITPVVGWLICGQDNSSGKYKDSTEHIYIWDTSHWLSESLSFKSLIPKSWLWWSDEVTILHMPRQQSCHGMCKIVTTSDHYVILKIKIFITRFGLWAHILSVKCVPCIMTGEAWRWGLCLMNLPHYGKN